MNDRDPDLHRKLSDLADAREVDVEGSLQRVSSTMGGRGAWNRAVTIVVAFAVAAAAGTFLVRSFGTGPRDELATPASETTSTPVGNPAGGRILFSVRDDSDGSEDVYSMLPDGSDVQPVLTGPEDDSGAVWSPDGTRIAFVRLDREGPCVDGNIYVANADGSDAVRLTGPPADPYECTPPSPMDPNQHYIVSAGASDDEPAWSPDGSQIAFRSNRGSNSSIWVMNADGSDPHQLLPGDAYMGDPIWSPDGSRVAFSSDQDLASGSFGTSIWIANADGTDPIRVTFEEGGDIVTGWSPDGSGLVFMRSVDQSDYSWDVWTVNVDGTHERQLTTWPGYDGGAIYSPDGMSLAFTSDEFGGSDAIAEGENGGYAHGLDVYVMPSEGGEPTRLTHFSPLVAYPSDWRAFGP
jgi:Tol biopolymer transport system component